MHALFGPSQPRDPVQRALLDAPVADDAGPWRRVETPMVGGLNALGFERQSEDLLVTSANGQSVISGQSGDIVYRNRDEDGLDAAALKGTRLDHPAAERIDMAGLFGGALRTQTDDGWSVARIVGAMVSRASETTHCLLHPPGASIHFAAPKWASYTKDTTFHLIQRETEDILAFGFSWTGRTLVLATPSSLLIWARPAPLPLA